MSPPEGPRGRSGSPTTHTPGKDPTPGPWRLIGIKNPRGWHEYDLITDDPDGPGTFATMRFEGDHEADALLIAAAPETAAERDRLQRALEAERGVSATLASRLARAHEALRDLAGWFTDHVSRDASAPADLVLAGCVNHLRGSVARARALLAEVEKP